MTIELFAKTTPGWWARSSIEIFTFPGGEPHARDNGFSKSIAQLAVVKQPTMKDLFALAAWADIVRARDEQVWLAMPYVPFARADRGVPLMADNFATFLGEVVRPDKIVALDIHSNVMREYLEEVAGEGFMEIPSYDLIPGAVRGQEYVGVITPDAGAHGRAAAAARALGVPTFIGEKHRDFETGKLSGFSVEDLPHKGRYLIVDDICDGGGTFIGLASAIHLRYGDDVQLDLWVSHGIFSKGFGELLQYFDNIYTTNSWAETPNWGSDHIHITDLTPTIFGALNG